MSNRLTAPVLIREEGDAGRSTSAVFGGGAIIGALGGLIGLGGAEFRLPLLIGAFRFAALQAVILNKAMSLVVVGSALPFRAATPLRQYHRAMADNRQSTRRQPAWRLVRRWLGNSPRAPHHRRSHQGRVQLRRDGFHGRAVCPRESRGSRPKSRPLVSRIPSLAACRSERAQPLRRSRLQSSAEWRQARASRSGAERCSPLPSARCKVRPPF